MNYYKCSDGSKVPSYQVEKNIKQAKAKKIELFLEEYGYIFCEDCADDKKNIKDELEFKIIDCSHTVSIKEAKEARKTELCWDVDNIKFRCRFHHKKHDKVY